MNKEKLNKLLSDIDLEIDLDDIATIDELDEAVQEYISEEEIIYYSNAMDYLHNNDSSLMTSLGLAYELGYTLDNLNSEKLATILLQDNLHADYQEIRAEAEELLDA